MEEVKKIDTSVNTTLVKVALTEIRFFDSASNTVITQKVLGKLSISECRKFVENLCKDDIYISKENIVEQFPVDTVALYSLKIN